MLSCEAIVRQRKADGGTEQPDLLAVDLEESLPAGVPGIEAAGLDGTRRRYERLVNPRRRVR